MWTTTKEGGEDMSLAAALAAKRQQLIQQAQERRPSVDVREGTHAYRIYRYWLDHSNKNITLESLCRFARVLMFWAPLYWLGDKLKAGPKLRGVRVPIIPCLLLIALCLALGRWVPWSHYTPVIIGVTAYTAIGLLATIYWGMMWSFRDEPNGFKRTLGPLATLRSARLVALVTAATLPVQLAAAIIIAAVAAFVILVVQIFGTHLFIRTYE